MYWKGKSVFCSISREFTVSFALCLLSQKRNHQLLKIQSVKLPFQVILGHKGSSLERQHWRDMISRLDFVRLYISKLPKFPIWLIVENNLFQPESSVKPVARSQIVNFNSVLFCIFYLCIFEISSN